MCLVWLLVRSPEQAALDFVKDKLQANATQGVHDSAGLAVLPMPEWSLE